MRKNILLLVFFVLVSFLIYSPLFNTFYQQDEWQGVGHMLALGYMGYITDGLNSVQIFWGEGRIFTALLNYFFFQTIPFNIMLLSIYAIFFHALNSFLLYILANKLLKSRLVAILSAIFFLIDTVGHQAVSWFGASISTLTATTLILISMIFLIKYLESTKEKNIWISYAFLFISFYFKEVGLGLLPAYIIIGLIKKQRHIKLRELSILFLPNLYFVGFAIYRTLEILLSHTHVAGYISSSSPLKKVIISQIFLYMSTSFGQLFAPPVAVFNFSKFFLPLGYTFLIKNPNLDIISQTIGADMLMIWLTAVILIVVYLLKKKEDTFLYFFSITIIMSSILPYSIVSRGSSYFESRYYYFAVIGASLLIGIVFKRINNLNNWVFFALSSVVFIVFSFWHISYTSQDLALQEQNAKVRISILNTIKSTIPTLKEKTVFYITGNQSYIMENNPLPFQQGLGYTILVWLHNPSIKEDNTLLVNNFLWDIGTEGYKQHGSEGFGYYYDYAQLKKSYLENKFLNSDIYAFYWDSQKNKLINNTEEIRRKLVQSSTLL